VPGIIAGGIELVPLSTDVTYAKTSDVMPTNPYAINGKGMTLIIYIIFII
jgi:hypothetical protein